MTAGDFRVVHVDAVPANTRRGGELRVMLSPATVGSTSGFMGVAVLAPGERVNEHYHPYSEEFIYVITGLVTLDLGGVPHGLREGEALLVPKNVRHRVRNTGDAEARLTFFLSPLAPRPELGHVDTEGGPG
ncbi:cupin domain-containing protein [Actinomadura graeca]|uniref:Cupin domain-containing protein n=1 Tax=Actinomadura graeca TaxID=2750812 RepID=A0ABX8QVS5_9ACTN|nr:cupin domain-containing protein [Actinomadura graeca]QXJ21832.1 cupin domain-containing protein [Actinomadura graeca]